jgi:hypothetical protein
MEDFSLAINFAINHFDYSDDFDGANPGLGKSGLRGLRPSG